MPKNEFKRLLQDGKSVAGSWIGFCDPYSAELMANAGFDWLLIDMEHFPLGREALRTILMACKGSDSAAVVRVPVNSREYVSAALDLGAQGVMIPMVNSLADAQKAVEFARYPPLGRRGMGPVRASRYMNDFERYRRDANKETALFVQIETPEGVANASQILSVNGIDGLFIGNGDLASFVNGGQPSPAVDRIVDELIVLAKNMSLPVGLPTWSSEEFRDYEQRGAQLLTIGSDMAFMAQAARTQLSSVRRLLKATEV